MKKLYRAIETSFVPVIRYLEPKEYCVTTALSFLDFQSV